MSSYDLEQYTADMTAAQTDADRVAVHTRGRDAGLPVGELGADAFSGDALHGAPGQPPLTPEPSSTDHPSQTDSKSRIAYTTSPDNIGKNWDGSDLNADDPIADIAAARKEFASATPDTMDRDWVYLPQAISSEYAIVLDSARDMVLTGNVTVDEKPIECRRGYVRRVDIVNRWVQVVSDVKCVRFMYSPDA